MKMFIMLLALLVSACSSPPQPLQSLQRQESAEFPLSQQTGRWDSGHVQGIAIDRQGGFIYYSFTNLLVKYDFSGNLVGTLEGWSGHLGDLDYNPADGKVYGSLEYKEAEAFYIAVIDVADLTRTGMRVDGSSIMTTVYLPEVVRDYSADMNGDGRFDGNIAETPDHRFGSSGIDGVSFGPEFGRLDGRHYLTVAYGIYSNTQRQDNDHQVLLQYDTSAWEQYAQPLVEAAPHHNGPEQVLGKYFVLTGNTRYGVQNLAYDSHLGRWFMGVYQGKKTQFPNYLLFAVDAETRAVSGDLVGVTSATGGWQQGLLLSLADDGLQDPETGIRGWMQKADVGLQPVGEGLFYLVTDAKGENWQSASLSLMSWTGETSQPFRSVQ